MKLSNVLAYYGRLLITDVKGYRRHGQIDSKKAVSREPLLKGSGGVTTVDLLIKIAHFVTKLDNVFNIKEMI
jgi:hypothetical protein